MFHSILVPLDISESRLTEQVVPYVQVNAAINNAKVHFLTVIPSFPYYSSLGLAYSVEMPKLMRYSRMH
jgi:universal stress protein F